MSFPDPLGLFSSPSSSSAGRSGLAPGQLFQALRANFGQQMQTMPQQQAQSMFPGANLGARPAAGNAAQTPAGLPTINLPGGVSLAPPSLPFANNPGNAGSTAPAPQTSGGLIGSAGNVLNTVTTTVRNILSPPGPTPGAQPPTTPGTAAPGTTPGPGNMAGTTPGLGNVPANVVNTAANVVRTAANALPGATTTIPQAANPVSTQALSTPSPAGPMQSASAQAPVQTQAMPGQPPASALQTPAQASQLQPAQTQAQPQTSSTLAQQSTSAPVLQQAQPARTDAPFAPAGNPATDRAGVPQQVQAPVQPNVPSAPQGAALLAAVPLATIVAQAPVAQQLAGNPQAQASGNPVAGMASLDAGGPVRAELTGAGTYTLDGPGLRRRGRMKVGAQELGQWMLAAAQGRLHLMRPYDDDTPREVAKAFQWLFWVLAIVAYGCLGLVLVSFLLSFGELPTAPTLRRWTGEFAWSGLLAAIGAWWLGRQLMRAQRPPRDPIRR